MDIKLYFENTAERLPEKSGEYLCFEGVDWIVLNYSAKHGLFNAHDDVPREHAERHAISVTWWAELPTI